MSAVAPTPTSVIISNGWDPGIGTSNLVGAICTYPCTYLRAAATAAAVASSWLSCLGTFFSSFEAFLTVN